jgi:chaperonin GroES
MAVMERFHSRVRRKGRLEIASNNLFIGKKRRRVAMKIRPLQDRILVKRLEGEETTKGGIIIPDTAKEKPSEGNVVAVGKGKVLENGTTMPLDVKVGDKVLFSKYSGSDVKIEGEDYMIMREDDILGIIEA